MKSVQNKILYRDLFVEWKQTTRQLQKGTHIQIKNCACEKHERFNTVPFHTNNICTWERW